MEKFNSVITPGFSKKDRSTFKYWFAHWCAFNLTALNLGCWKWRFLLHDIEKPWLKLILKDYSKVQKWHREHSRHHITSYARAHGGNFSKCDWLGAVIDWECSRYSKTGAPLTAREEYDKKVNNEDGKYSKDEVLQFVIHIGTILNSLGL